MHTSSAPGRRSRFFLLAFLVAFTVAAVAPLANPAPTEASTASTMEARILSWINVERAKRGIPALQKRVSLMDFANDRAYTMARSKQLKHPSCLGCKLSQRHISWNRCGETIAYTTWPWGTQAAKSIFNGWKGSAPHWSLLMSPSYRRIGIGVAYRPSNRSTWAAAVLTN